MDQDKKADLDEAKQDDDLKDLEIVVEGAPGAAPEEKKDDVDDERRAKEGGDARDDKEEDRDDPNLSPEQREKREKRREERKLRKERRDAERREIEELRREVAELRAAHGQVDQRIKTDQHKRVEAALNDSVAQMREAKRLLAEAKEKENWGAHSEALEAYFEARDRARNLHHMKTQMEQTQEGAREEQDPEVERRARDWRAKNDWYDPNGRDQDSRIAAAIDEQLASEGYNPRTPGYWEELDKRLAKQLPHRVKTRHAADDLDDDLDERPSQTTGSGRERASGKRVFRISAQRLAALKEAGVDTNDPKAMAPYIKQYMAWDKENADLLGRK